MNELDYERGGKAAWARMLQVCLLNLGHGSGEAAHAAWVLERAAAVEALREVCEHYGDNDWPDTLHLADVVDKHLLRHLSAPADPQEG